MLVVSGLRVLLWLLLGFPQLSVRPVRSLEPCYGSVVLVLMEPPELMLITLSALALRRPELVSRDVLLSCSMEVALLLCFPWVSLRSGLAKSNTESGVLVILVSPLVLFLLSGDLFPGSGSSSVSCVVPVHCVSSSSEWRIMSTTEVCGLPLVCAGGDVMLLLLC